MIKGGYVEIDLEGITFSEGTTVITNNYGYKQSEPVKINGLYEKLDKNKFVRIKNLRNINISIIDNTAYEGDIAPLVCYKNSRYRIVFPTFINSVNNSGNITNQIVQCYMEVDSADGVVFYEKFKTL